MSPIRSTGAKRRLSLGAVATVVVGLMLAIGLVTFTMAGAWLSINLADLSIAAKANPLSFGG